MKVVFLGKCKQSAVRSLAWLIDEGCSIAAVVSAPPDPWTRPEQRLDLLAERHQIPLVSESELYRAIDDRSAGLDLDDVDLVISFLFWKRIRAPLIALGSAGCLNFHPAPLPDIRGIGGYNVAILEGLDRWGVSCHFVDDEFDTGDVVAVDRFRIDPDAETAFSLDERSQARLFILFREVLGIALAGQELPRTSQQSLGPARYVTRAEIEELRKVGEGDDPDRKMRAFWYPPYPGATVEVGGRSFTIVDATLLAEIADLYRAGGRIP